MPKQREIKIPKEFIPELDACDRMLREHTLLAQLLREEIIRAQGAIIAKVDKDLFERFKRQFVTAQIDWAKKTIVFVATDDPNLKAQEVEYELAREAEHGKK